MPGDIEVALLSSNALLRDGLVHLLGQRSITVASATRHPEKLCLTSRQSDGCRHIILIDSTLPVEEGFYLGLRDMHPGTRLVVLADVFDVAAAVGAFREGVDGYLLTNTSPDILVASLHLIAAGEKLIPTGLAIHALENSYPAAPAPDLKLLNLSDREISVLQLLVRGACNKVIGRQLGIQEATVKVHVKAALRKLRVSNRTQAAIWAVRHGLSAGGGEDYADRPLSGRHAPAPHGNLGLILPVSKHAHAPLKVQEEQRPYQAASNDRCPNGAIARDMSAVAAGPHDRNDIPLHLRPFATPISRRLNDVDG